MIATHALHGFAWVALRCVSPPLAFRLTRDLGRLLPPLPASEIERATRRLRGGTCLTRSLTLAARIPGATVTIGGAKADGVFSAHAWVELEGTAVSGQTSADTILARLG